ncbi:flavodoxin family protein [Porticoccaceae bacterium]|nr:flavodoxin family protein [Porticoccaceae bacterium]
MPKVGFVYYTKTDITGALVVAAIAELKVNGAEVFYHQIQGSEIIEGRFVNAEVFESLSNCDAIVFASPTYMGGVAAQFKAFADASSDVWCTQGWSGKVASGITSGSALNGDQSSTLQYMATLASQHGMVWIGLESATQHEKKIDRLGCQLGVVSQSDDGEVDDVDLATARHLVHRIVNLLR